MFDVGFFEYDLAGVLVYANNSWHTLSGHPYDPEGHTQHKVLDLFHPDDVETVSKAWVGLLQGNSTTFEMRWKHISSPSAQTLGAQWVFAACLPLYDGSGNIRSISGCTTDINNQKLSEINAHSRALAMELARSSEQRFIRFAHIAPIVISTLDADSRMTYCNDRWFEWTATVKKQFEEIDIINGFLESDSQNLTDTIKQAILDHDVHSIGMRTNKMWYASDGRRAQAWVLASAFAEFSTEGEYLGCKGTLTDISEFKYAKVLQRMRLDDALEAKRSQETIMDMASHEIRNPLCAMVQCTDSVTLAVSDVATLIRSCASDNGNYATNTEPMRQILEHIDLAADGLNTIQSCCSHMRSIVDDVHTLSKIDANLVNIAPTRSDPRAVMEDVVKLFQMEARKADVEVIPEIEPSVEELHVQHLMFDQSRVKQILMNLLSNAIKFTRTDAVRTVVVKLSVQREAPNTCSEGIIHYAPTSRTVPDGLLDQSEWGDGERIYLQCAVSDTGRGLSSRERMKLLHRFSQASPKTHAVYGGSGLGLFITLQLTELQGGEIGVASEVGKGSTFAFYIQTRRCAPTEPVERTLLSPLSNVTQMPGTTTTTKRTQDSTSLSEVPSSKKRDPRALIQPGAQMPLPGWSPRVLIVEDNIVNPKVLSTQLKRLGCKIAVAGNGVEALEFLKTTDLWRGEDPLEQGLRQSLDIVLMDIEMPVMNGVESTMKIREYECEGIIGPPSTYRLHHQLPIISISANARAEQGQEQKEAGVDDIVIKPFRVPHLMDKIWRLVGNKPQAEADAGSGVEAQLPSPASN